MSLYSKWLRNKSKDDVPFIKPRSYSLDTRSLELSGIGNFTVLQNV